MNNYEPYNPNSEIEKKEVLVTNRLFIVSLTIYALTFILFAFQDQFGISQELFNGLFSILILTAFLLNVFGVIKGIKEWNVNREMAINGIVGNLIPILALFVLTGVAIYYFDQLGSLELNFKIP